MALGVAGHRLWNGAPYPADDPDRVAARLKWEAGLVYGEAALPGARDASSRVETGVCYNRGLRAIAHIDEGRSDVGSFGLSWQVAGISEAVARSAQERTRLRLAREGWKRTSFSDRGFRFEHPESGDKVDVDWYRSTGTFAVSTYAPCGGLPDRFNAYDWPQANWAAPE